jgi:hypothetical protein
VREDKKPSSAPFNQNWLNGESGYNGDYEPPMALDRFMELSGLSAVTLYRWRKSGFLKTLNISGRLYVARSEIARFNARAAAGEFAKQIVRPPRGRRESSRGGEIGNTKSRV